MGVPLFLRILEVHGHRRYDDRISATSTMLQNDVPSHFTGFSVTMDEVFDVNFMFMMYLDYHGWHFTTA